MKVMLLAAGRGERMRPLTDDRPKPLLKAGGKALIVHLIESLVAEGFQDLVINHAWQGAMIEQTLGDGRTFGAHIQYSPEGDQALETGGGIHHALPLLGDKPFMAVNADIWTDFPFGNLPDSLETRAHLVLVDNPAHHPKGDFTLVGTRLGTGEENRLTFSGIGVYHPELFAGIPQPRFPLAPLLRECCNAGLASGVHYNGEWWDVGTPERLGRLDRRLSRQAEK